MTFVKTPLQVYVDAQDAERLAAWSREHGLTKSQAIRALIRAVTRRGPDDDLLDMSGTIHGLPRDLSERIDRHLEETYRAEAPRAATRRRRPVARVRR